MATTRTTTDYTDFAKRAFTPATRFNEVMVGNIERVARFQYELTGDLMQFALDQMNATVKAKDLPTLLSKQREIATKFAEKATTRQQALAEMATESQAGFARWIEDATWLTAAVIPDPLSPPLVVFAPHFMHRTMAQVHSRP
jgi:phasin family protein